MNYQIHLIVLVILVRSDNNFQVTMKRVTYKIYLHPFWRIIYNFLIEVTFINT